MRDCDLYEINCIYTTIAMNRIARLLGVKEVENQNYDALKLENQICFPLYAAAREIIKQYKPMLDDMDLTYTQYIVMLVLWEEKAITTKALGQKLYLDSGTLTPLLKKMEVKGLVTRKRSAYDERNLDVTITEKGEALKEQAITIPAQIAESTNLDSDEAMMLYTMLYKILNPHNAEK